MKILIVDDDQNISLVARLALERLGGHDVSVARDGDEALKLARASVFDVVLLDRSMPSRDGLDVAQEIRASFVAPPPVVFLSASSDAEDLARFATEGTGYIAKPFDPRTLCAQLDGILARKRR